MVGDQDGTGDAGDVEDLASVCLEIPEIQAERLLKKAWESGRKARQWSQPRALGVSRPRGVRS
jgi:hypothetical protein